MLDLCVIVIITNTLQWHYHAHMPAVLRTCTKMHMALTYHFVRPHREEVRHKC